jgi:septal ring factor EnvC (AmiA/AmiB activator)
VIAHNEYVTSMNATIADRESHLEDLREKEANLQDSIAAAEQGLADAEAKRELYINLIAEQQQLCEDRRQLYFRETDERNEELDVVDQVNTIVNDRMLGMDPYLEERVNV